MTSEDGSHGPGNTEAAWRSSARWFVATALGSSAFLYLLVLIIDPYNSVPFSPGWENLPRYEPVPTI